MRRFSEEIESALKRLAADSSSGAAVLLKQACWCFISLAEEEKEGSFEAFWEQLYELAQALISSQPDMAPLYFLAENLLAKVREEAQKDPSPRRLSKTVRKSALEILQYVETAPGFLLPLVSELVQEGDVLMTCSYSSTLFESLKALARTGRRFEVVVGESRPRCEGLQLARDLSACSVPTTLIVDAAAMCELPRCSQVIVGADRVSEELFVNKIGTYALALLARERKKPFYLLCDTTKFVPGGRFGSDRKAHPPEEIVSDPPKQMKVSNPYFEEVPLSLASGILCEKGLLSPEEAAGSIKKFFHLLDAEGR